MSKRWAGIPVLDEVHLRLPGGSAAAISGANGAGKTTLLRIVAGLITPDAGAVTVDALSPERDRVRFQQRIGFLGAGNSGLYGRLTPEHHLELWARLALLPRARRRSAVAHAVQTFELSPLLRQRVDRLSMGQRQRLRLALAFLHEPTLVLLDEPATSLDGDGIAVLARALDEHRTRAGSALICIPTGWEQMVAVDRRLRLEQGTLVPA